MSAEAHPGLPPSKLQLLRAGELVAELALVDREEWLLGSADTADLRVQHSTVDAAHARVFLSEGEVFVEDLGSRAGTFVRGRRVQAPVKLMHRDQVLLGQHYVVKPLLVRYFDAAAHVLEDLGLVERPATPALPAVTTAERELPQKASPTRPTETAPGDGDTETPSVREGSGRRFLRHLWKPLAFVAACIVAVVIILSLLRPTEAVWRTVNITPTVISAGDELEMVGQEIRPQGDLRIHIGGRLAQVLESGRGRLRIQAPALIDRPAGSYDVSLKVYNGQFEAYQWMLRYVVHPAIDRIAPSPAEVGSRVSIVGSGLADAPEDIRVSFGDQEVPVLSATAGEVVVRVPVVTRTHPVHVPVEVRVADEVARAAESLRVLPRTPRPLDFRFAARFAEARGAWELSTLFGPFFYLPSDPGGGTDTASEDGGDAEDPTDRPATDREIAAEGDRRGATQGGATRSAEESDRPAPRHIQALVRQWKRALNQARAEASFQVVAESPEESGCRLLGRAGDGSEGLPLGRWEGNSLRRLMAPEREDLSDEMLCQWFAGISNRFLQVFARGEPIATGGPLADYALVLNRLVRRNRELGGDGRPELSEIEELSPEQREHLRRAFLPVPRDLGSVAGQWRVELDNVFGDAEAEHRYVIDMDLTQREGRLTGQASSALVRTGMEIGFGTRGAQGALKLGAPTQVTIRTSLPGPIGAIDLRGVLEDGRLGGTFETSEGKTGNWTATRRESGT